MMFSTFFPSILIVAISALAASSSLATPYADHRAQPMNLLESTINGTSHVIYSANWGGSVWYNSTNGTFKSVTGTFIVPSPSAPNGSASVWVGIDGASCRTAILQTGITMTYAGGKISYQAWYEWYPDFAYPFPDGIDIEAGDVIRLTVTAFSKTSGVATIDNVFKYQTVSKKLFSFAPLCERDAEWIVEDYKMGVSLVPFCDFGTVNFFDAYAQMANDSIVSPGGAPVAEIRQKGRVLTSVFEYPGGVTISYK